MINFEILKSKVNNLLNKYYPIKTNFNNIYNFI